MTDMGGVTEIRVLQHLVSWIQLLGKAEVGRADDILRYEHIPDHGSEAIQPHRVSHAQGLENHAQRLEQPNLTNAVQGVHRHQGWDWGVEPW